MPTSNPSDEQLELVTGRVIELAQALYPYVALDDGAYFDTAGFDEHMAAELAARVEGYCRNADGVAISPLEEQPTPRRLPVPELLQLQQRFCWRAVKPCLSQLWPICSKRPSSMR